MRVILSPNLERKRRVRKVDAVVLAQVPGQIGGTALKRGGRLPTEGNDLNVAPSRPRRLQA